jgi:hypothetical protein
MLEGGWDDVEGEAGQAAPLRQGGSCGIGITEREWVLPYINGPFNVCPEIMF